MLNPILGLADVALRKKAAEAISNGLRMGGNFKVLFFITENRGRVSQQDATTLKLVLDAAPEIKEKYSIIVNMVSKKVLQKLEKESAYHYFNDLIFAGIDEKNRCSFSNIIFFERREDLEGEDNIVVPPNTFINPNGTTLTKFVHEIVPTISIQQEKVFDIKVDEFDTIRKQLEELASKIQKIDEEKKEERQYYEQRRVEKATKSKEKLRSREAYDKIMHIMSNWEVSNT